MKFCDWWLRNLREVKSERPSILFPSLLDSSRFFLNSSSTPSRLIFIIWSENFLINLTQPIERFSNYEESGEIHAQLLNTEIELSEKKKECGLLSEQVQEFQLSLSEATSQYQKVFLPFFHVLNYDKKFQGICRFLEVCWHVVKEEGL